MANVSEDPLDDMDDCEDDVDMRSLCKDLTIEDIIELDDEEEEEDRMGSIDLVEASSAIDEDIEDRILDDIDMTVSIYSETIDEDETDLDEDDVAEFRKETKDDDMTSGSITSEAKETSAATSEGDSSHKDEADQSEQTKSPCLSEEKLLAMKRKQALKKIRKLPISERFILHGRNLLPWKQKVFHSSLRSIMLTFVDGLISVGKLQRV